MIEKKIREFTMAEKSLKQLLGDKAKADASVKKLKDQIAAQQKLLKALAPKIKDAKAKEAAAKKAAPKKGAKKAAKKAVKKAVKK